MQLQSLWAYLKDSVGSVPDHHNKMSITSVGSVPDHHNKVNITIK